MFANAADPLRIDWTGETRHSRPTAERSGSELPYSTSPKTASRHFFSYGHFQPVISWLSIPCS
jgi:hypothetical protein